MQMSWFAYLNIKLKGGVWVFYVVSILSIYIERRLIYG